MPDRFARSAFEAARVLDIRGLHTWAGLVVPDTESIELFTGDLAEELTAQTGVCSRVIDVTTLTVGDVITQVQADGSDCVMLSHFEPWTSGQWKALDTDRDSLLRQGPVVFVLSPVSAALLSRSASNLRSFLGPLHSAGFDSSNMSDTERNYRLSELRQFYGLSDEEIVAAADAKTLAPEPHFVEWLMLMDRGDLV